MRALSLAVCFAAVLASGACKKPESAPETVAEVPSASPPATASAVAAKPAPQLPPASAEAMAIAWDDPASWKRVPPKNQMRLASYEIPAAAGDAEGGELNVFYFGPRRAGTADPVEANVSRWLAQFQGVNPEQVVRATKEVNSLKQHTVEIASGTFASGGMMMGAPPVQKENFGLLGAIVESSKGDYFFKLTGPAKTLAAAKPAFDSLLQSIKSNP